MARAVTIDTILDTGERAERGGNRWQLGFGEPVYA
jgi:hypothetical protein